MATDGGGYASAVHQSGGESVACRLGAEGVRQALHVEADWLKLKTLCAEPGSYAM